MLRLQLYEDKYEKRWDEFVLHNSLNGTFLHTRNFLNYHPNGRFKDNSLLFMKGDTIVAVISANVIWQDDKKTLISHQGSTFGGIVLGKQYKKISICEEIFNLLDEYAKEQDLCKIVMKYTSSLYAQSESELLDYFAFLKGYTQRSEMGYFIDFEKYQDDILANLTTSKRRDYRYSLKNNLSFTELTDEHSIRTFYDILCDNYKKFNKTPVHTCDELLEFMEIRLPDRVRFYGVMLENEIIAGSMVFLFDGVYHTQYIACRQDKTSLFANDFLYVNLIQTAKSLGFPKISFGISTLEGGKVLNTHLAQFKEAFGSTEYINRIYEKGYVNEDTIY